MNTRSQTLAAMLLVVEALTVTAYADPILYATAGPGTSLVRLDVGMQKITLLGDFGVPGADAIAINSNGVAFTVTHGWPPGGDSQLARVDLASGKATAFGMSLKGENFMGLGFAPDGTLYGVNAASGTTDAGSLYRFDPITGAATKVGITGGCSNIMDLAWAPDGLMYGAVNDSLYRVDAVTGHATLVARLTGVSRVMGLAIDGSGNFYVSEIVSNAPLLRVDPSTGATTKLFETGVDFIHGLAIAPVEAPVIRATTTLQPQAVYIGKACQFAVSGTGIAPLTYQWRLNGQELPGKTNKNLTIPAAMPPDEGDYTVEVANPGGTSVSHSVRLWVVPTNEFQKLFYTNAANARLPYLIRYPLTYDPARRYPLVVKLYGSPWHEGVLPAEFWNYPRVALEGSYGLQSQDPVILLYPTQRREVAGSDWSSQEVMLVAELVDRLLTELPVDLERVYVRGGSISLWATVELLRLRHKSFAAATLVSGTIRANSVLKDLPIWTIQTLQEGIGLGAFAQELRAFGGRPIHTEFTTASHADVAQAGTTTMVVEWLMSQRRGQRAAARPEVTIDGSEVGATRRTGANVVTLTGSADALGGKLTGLSWSNATTRLTDNVSVTNRRFAASVPLAAQKTNTIVVTAASDATSMLGLPGTTTFSETLSVFSTPVGLRLTPMGAEAVLDWTGGVPPFRVLRTTSLPDGNWTLLGTDLTPPIKVSLGAAMEFYRVEGQ